MDEEKFTPLTNKELTEKIAELHIIIRELGAKVNELELHQYGYGG